MTYNIKNQMKELIQLSIVDKHFADPERSHVYIIGKANGLSEENIDEFVKEVLGAKKNLELEYQYMIPEEKFHYLYDIIQLMKVDKNVFLSEIKYCEEVAERLGYNKKVVKQMASRIYGDPLITANRDALLKDANKFLKQ